jgi:hypothetical protein
MVRPSTSSSTGATTGGAFPRDRRLLGCGNRWSCFPPFAARGRSLSQTLKNARSSLRFFKVISLPWPVGAKPTACYKGLAIKEWRLRKPQP